MRKNHHIFIILIIIILYILYSIVSYKYKEYNINSHIEYITNLNEEIKQKIQEAESIVEYKKSSAYKNKVLKEEQWLKDKWENVIYLTSEDTYNKYTNSISKEETPIVEVEKEIDKTYWMTVYQKWIYFLFKKDLR